jgi:hypothetical protein
LNLQSTVRVPTVILWNRFLRASSTGQRNAGVAAAVEQLQSPPVAYKGVVPCSLSPSFHSHRYLFVLYLLQEQRHCRLLCQARLAVAPLIAVELRLAEPSASISGT